MKAHIERRGKRYYVVVEEARDPQTGKRRRSYRSGYGTKKEARQGSARS